MTFDKAEVLFDSKLRKPFITKNNYFAKATFGLIYGNANLYIILKT